MKTIKSVLFCLVVVLFASCGELFNTPDTPDNKNTLGSIYGLVCDSETLEEISGATVSINSINKTTTSDEEGFYYLHDLEAGRYLVSASAIGYHPIEGTVAVEAGKDTMIFIYLDKIVTTANLTGTVVDSETGENIAGAKVVVNPGNLSTYSNKDGYYEFENLEVGKYTITASADFYADVEGEIELTTAGANITIKMTRTVVEDYSSVIVESFDNRMKADIVSCRRIGSKVEFNFQLTSVGMGDVEVTIYGNQGNSNTTIIADNLGNLYSGSVLTLGTQSNYYYTDGYVKSPLLEYVPVKASVTIPDVPNNAELLHIKLNVSVWSNGNYIANSDWIKISNLPIY